MSQLLFRQKVVKHRSERPLEEAIISRPVSYQILAVLMAAGMLTALIFLVANDYTRRETVAGYLIPARGVIAVDPVQPGLLIETFVDGLMVSTTSILIPVYSSAPCLLVLALLDIDQTRFVLHTASGRKNEELSAVLGMTYSELSRGALENTAIDRTLCARVERNQVEQQLRTIWAELDNRSQISLKGRM